MTQEQIKRELEETTDDRRHFRTGAVRDTNKGKGRFDCVDLEALKSVDDVLSGISTIQGDLSCGASGEAIKNIRNTISLVVLTAGYDAILQLGKVAERGADKYGEGNWMKGIPCSSFIDSAVRHWCKYRQGWLDENHLGSAMWNLMALHWTMLNRPECNDLWEKKI